MKMARTIVLALLLSPAIAVAEPVALVLDVTGDVSPTLRAFDEIDADTKLTLAEGASVTIEHYAICEQVTIGGGTLLVGEKALDLDDAQSVARRPVECPEVVQLPVEKVNAGVIVRDVSLAWKRDVTPRIGLAPSILVPGRDGVNDLRIERDGEEVATLAIIDGRSLWPEGARELQAGERYDLILSDGEEAHRMEVLTDGDARARLVVRLPAAE